MKTCRQGHPIEGGNVIVYQSKPGKFGVRCRTCYNRRNLERYYRQQHQPPPPSDPALLSKGRGGRALRTVEARVGLPLKEWARLPKEVRNEYHIQWSDEMKRLARLPGAQIPWRAEWDEDRAPNPENEDALDEEEEDDSIDGPGAPGDHTGPSVLRARAA